MAMIKCPECGKEMSDRAGACPNCGCPMDEIRRSLGEIEAERAAKLKEKEEEKKAKEVAAEIRKRKQEEARKAVTPEMKRKRSLIASLIAVLVIIAGVCGWYFGIKVPKDNAYAAYLETVQSTAETVKEYNAAVEAYNNKAKQVIAANDSFDASIKEAQDLIDSGDTPYEGEKITVLSNTLKDARNNKTATPELKETEESVTADETLEKQSKAAISSETQRLTSVADEYSEKTGSVKSETDNIQIPDYSSYVSTIKAQEQDLEDSYAIQKQIMEPSEDWVIARLGRIDDVATIAPVTEEHDPNGHLNKTGGYTATVYFMTPLLGTENLTGYDLIEEGTSGGGAVEVYRTVEDAESRNDYLGALDGGIFASGSHVVLGTMVLRTSDELKASQQETLTNAMIAAMIELD